ncbi:AAA family ATPase [Gloeopeniophorella convolvens]|nr:AAA family ATPase [Gloeopeniophorella convolvens]
MTEISSRTFIARIADSDDVSERAIRRIIVNSDVVKATKLCAGDVVALVDLSASQENGKQKRPFSVGTLWPSLELDSDTVEIAVNLMNTARLTEGSKTVIFPLNVQGTNTLPSWLPSLRKMPQADAVRLRELVMLDVNDAPMRVLASKDKPDKEKQRDWLTLLARETLGTNGSVVWPAVDLKYISHSQAISVQYEGKDRLFCVSFVSTPSDGNWSFPATIMNDPTSDISEDLAVLNVEDTPLLFTVSWDTTVAIEDATQVSEPKLATQLDVGVSEQKDGANAYAAVGGLDAQIAQVRDLIEIPLRRPELFRHFGLKPPRGLLLHGPPGTGKTHLARAISTSTGSSVITVNGPELTSAYHGETEASLRRVFATARARAPCIVILDEVDAICPLREDGAGGEAEKRVVATLLTEMDGMDAEEGARVVVVATTNRPNAIDPALRRPGRFDREIEIGVPDLNARISILKVLLTKTPNDILPDQLEAIASRAHGYVGADLAAVVREAGTLAIKRFLASSLQPITAARLTAEDLTAALPSVRPSALRAHALTAPPVRFADIGGLAHTIARLRECVEWPLVHRAALARLGVRAPKGVLLCGPPGCSKTVLVRATAAESGVNFVAVRGPELLNKYVGESERAVREIFRKARSAAPSIIFFDEIDALATSRSQGATDGGTHEGVLFSLLNEMDGVEELVGVTVIGATNRPEALDPALVRPGRLDRILYVGPPDFAGRVEIFRIRTRSMSVDPALDFDTLASLTSGCSGAEITAVCQEAALITMQEDINAAFVPRHAFIAAAKAVKRQITPEMLQKFERWRDEHGVSTVA